MPPAQQKQKKHVASHIMATNAKEITLKSLSGTTQQLRINSKRY